LADQRPFLNFYAPTFVLYELSSPFLNIHWFLDKLKLTGSKYQWYNGIVLLVTFFGCRLVWGTYQSIRVYQDVWAALNLPASAASEFTLLQQGNVTAAGQGLFVPHDGALCLGNLECVAAQSEVMKFVDPRTQSVPMWLAITYMSSNVILNSLNFYWFGKMIDTVRKRFDKYPPAVSDEKHDEKKLEDRATVPGRKSSIVLEVADGLERDESFTVMMDGTAEGHAPQTDRSQPVEHEHQPHPPIEVRIKQSTNAQSSALDDTRAISSRRR
jgi:hypothetical protein